MEKRVVILSTQSGDWEGLFIDNKLITEGHTLGEGNSRTFLLEKSEIFNFKFDDVICSELNDEDEDTLCSTGNFPRLLSELKGTYNIKK